LAGTAHGQGADSMSCGDLSNAYGPYDYADPLDKAQRLTIVENYHFTPEVETLRAGKSGSLASDIDYTLRAFPNHHRALWSVAQLELRNKGPLREFRSAECYFDRALRWRPNDPMVHTVYAIFLSRRGDTKGALARYKEALSLAPDNAEVNYNAGLLYFELNDLESARKHAKIAYDLGYPLPGLKNKLKQKNMWTDTPTAGKAGVKPAVAQQK
jgi:Flp pilus assembly protein TadD